MAPTAVVNSEFFRRAVSRLLPVYISRYRYDITLASLYGHISWARQGREAAQERQQRETISRASFDWEGSTSKEEEDGREEEEVGRVDEEGRG